MHATRVLLGSIGAFVGGAMLSGLIIQDSTLRLGRRHVGALTLESVLSVAGFAGLAYVGYRQHRRGSEAP